MLLTPEERRAMLALVGLLLLGQAVSIWQEHRRSLPDRELSAWLTRIASARDDSAGVRGADSGMAFAAGFAGTADSMDTTGSAASTAPDRESEEGGADSRPDTIRAEPASAVPDGLLETGRIRVNTASVRDLEELPRVGPALAARIVAERERGGPFQRPEDLLRVRGIGPKTLALIRARVDFGQKK